MLRAQPKRGDTSRGRLGNADDIGQKALFLVSDASAFINGTIIDVNGGS